MLRAHVDQHLVGADVEFDDRGIVEMRGHAIRCCNVVYVTDDLPAANAVIFERHFVIFAQRMADPVFRAEDAPQVRMADEVHAGQVVDFALVPVGRAARRR